MSNQPIGSHFLEGVLGVVTPEFGGEDLGKTGEDTEIEFVEDITDILHAQDGTQPYDKIPTGQGYVVRCKFTEPSNTVVAALQRGVTLSGDGKSANLGRDIYRSGRENFTKLLKLKRVDSNGQASTDPLFILNFYKAMWTTTSAILYGPESQRMIEGEFYIFFDEDNLTFGYTGYATSLGL